MLILVVFLMLMAAPVQAAIFFDDSFETCTVGTGSDFPCEGWTDVGSEHLPEMQVSTTKAYSGSKSVRMQWLSTTDTGFNPSIYKTFTTPQDYVFMRFVTRREAGWTQAANGNTKLFIIGNLDYPRPIFGDNFNQYSLHIECPYNIINPATGISWTTYKIDTGIVPTSTEGAWDQIELELRLNTPGSADGLARIWINGILRREVLNLELRGPTPTSLPGNCTNKPAASTMQFKTIQLYKQVGLGVRYMDRIAAGNTRIGLVGSPIPGDTTPPTPPTSLTAQ